VTKEAVETILAALVAAKAAAKRQPALNAEIGNALRAIEPEVRRHGIV
jgi:hypothetical protein